MGKEPGTTEKEEGAHKKKEDSNLQKNLMPELEEYEGLCATKSRFPNPSESTRAGGVSYYLI